ncbi:hypothetical protein ACH5RR_015805 [Cinchona calisaya]|uniref:Uncharacterized protein n=1 Tax=Cinchona calisaya TaxID=153742 RepID=A0ABD2ZW41_9GENT
MNTAHISQEEISLSLSDLSILGGLPFSGLFYDEVVPAKTLFSSVDKQRKKFIPPNCQYLFATFRHLCEGSKKTSKLGSIHFIMEGATLDGPGSSDNTNLGPNQFELVTRNLGKPYDLIPFSNIEKRLPMMPTTPILTQPIPCALIAASIFSITAITSEQHRKAALGIGERIQQQILETLFERLLEYSDRFARLFRVIELDRLDPSPLRTRFKNLLTHISKYQELHNNFSVNLIETALSTHLTTIQRQVERLLLQVRESRSILKPSKLNK